MLTTAEPLTLDLGSTATYASRVCEWVPVAPGEGLLVIRLRKHKGGGHASAYAVKEQDTGNRAVREFLVEDPNNGKQGDAYLVTVGGNPKNPCSCDAGMALKKCKHLDALAELVKKDAI